MAGRAAVPARAAAPGRLLGWHRGRWYQRCLAAVTRSAAGRLRCLATLERSTGRLRRLATVASSIGGLWRLATLARAVRRLCCLARESRTAGRLARGLPGRRGSPTNPAVRASDAGRGRPGSRVAAVTHPDVVWLLTPTPAADAIE
jgi:hypothetical protein